MNTGYIYPRWSAAKFSLIRRIFQKLPKEHVDDLKGHSGDEMNERADELAHAATGLNPREIAKFKERYHGIHA